MFGPLQGYQQVDCIQKNINTVHSVAGAQVLS